MNRKKHFLLILVTLVLSLTLAFSLFACNRGGSPDESEGKVDEEALLANGTFTGVNSETYPKSPSSWSGSAGSSNGSLATPSVQGTDVLNGVINVKSDLFKSNQNKWKIEGANPGKATGSKDNNILMMNNLTATSYRYSSSNVNIERDAYYKVTIWVKTLGEAKATMFVLGDAYAEFKDIDTDDKWVEYNAYIEGAADGNKAINIVLANGWGDKNGKLSKGLVLYDDIKVEKLEKKDVPNYGKDEYNKAVAAKKATYSMKQSDTDFSYTTGSTAPYSPSKYSGAAGNTEGSPNAPYNTSHTVYGVVDALDNDYTSLYLDAAPVPCKQAKDTKMLFINNRKSTAYGYRARVPFVIKAGKKYEVSAMVRTLNISGTNGAILRLVESGAEVDLNNQFIIKNTDQSKNNGWEKFTFDIVGNQLTDTQVYLELWLGEGGEIDKDKWTKGTVFMDAISFNEVNATANQDANATALVEGESDIIEHKLPNPVEYTESIDDSNNMLPGYIMDDATNGWAQLGSIPDSKKFDAELYDFYEYNKNGFTANGAVVPYAQHQVITAKSGELPADGIMIKTKANPEGVALTQAIKMSLNKPTAYSFIIDKDRTAHDLTFKRSSYYKISMWVKADLDEKYAGKGINVKLKSFNEDEDKADTVIASFDNINTSELKTNNKFTQLTFYVQADDKKPTPFYIEVSLGSGTRYDATNHIQGDAYITLVNMETITYDDYTKAGSNSNVKKTSLITNSGVTASVANGNFSDMDIATTNDNYTKYQGIKKDENGKDVLDENGEKVYNKVDFTNDEGEYVQPTAPTSWTISNKAYLEALNTGIVSNNDQFKNINNYSSLDSNFESFMKSKYPDPSKIPADMKLGSALVIATKNTSNKGFLTVPTSPDTCGCEICKKEGKTVCDGTHEGADCLHTNKSGLLPVGYTSSSISLSANQYYMVSVKVLVGSGTASVVLNNNNQDTKVTLLPTGSWQTVRFYINTGLSSTNVKLELYLGDKGVNQRSTGVVAFDNAAFDTVDKVDFDKAKALKDANTKTIEYVTDSFAIDKHDTEGGLESPVNWTGKLATNGSSEAESLAKGVFDKNYTRNDALKTNDKNGVPVQLKDTIYNEILLGETVKDNNFLVINNIVRNGYSFENTSKRTLDKNNFYRVSVDVMTYGLKADESAYITLKLNNATYTFENTVDEKDPKKSVLVNTSTYDKDGNETMTKKWRTYTFYISTPAKEQVNDVTITLGLGKASDNKDKKDENFVQGYAFFDDVVFEAMSIDGKDKFTKEDFDKIAKNDATNMTIRLTDDDVIKKEEDKKEEEAKPENNLLWLYITSGVIGGLILVVIVVVIFKKYWPAISKFFNKKTGKNMSDYDKNNPNTNKDQKKTNKSKNEFKD